MNAMDNLLQKVLNLPEFKNYTEISKNDWRNPLDENASFSISSKGWFDHKSGKSGSLIQLLPNIDVKKIYKNSKQEFFNIKKYFKSRSIKITTDQIIELGCRINYYNNDISIVTPIKTINGDIIQLHVIPVDSSFRKLGKKKILGKNLKNQDRCIAIKRHGKRYAVVEGLEDGLVLSELYPQHTILVCCGAKQMRRVKKFIRHSVTTIVILDNDTDPQQPSLKYSFFLGESVKRLMPVQKVDANQAKQEGWLQEWFETLQEMTFEDSKELNQDLFSEMTAMIDTINEKHAIVSLQGKVVVLNHEYDPVLKRKCVTFSSQADFALRYRTKKLKVTDNKGETKPIEVSKLWLNSHERLQYDGLIFDPSDQADNEKYFNIWQGFSYESDPTGNCDIYYDHMFNNVCQGDERHYNYLLDWMANCIQNPTNKAGVAIIIRGGQGTGKGVFINFFRELFGPHGLYIQDMQHLVGRFNAHLKECVLLFADEIFVTGDKAHEGRLKGLITETIQMVEYKGKDIIQFSNHINLMMSSNERYVAPLDHDDRRYFILDIGTARRRDYDYFSAMEKQFKTENGYGKLMHDLIQRPLTTANLRNFPDTIGIIENKISSFNSVESWLYNLLCHNMLPNNIRMRDLYDDYKATVGDGKAYGINRWSSLLREIHPTGIVSRRVFGKQGVFLFFDDTLSCRNALSDHVGINLEYPTLSETFHDGGTFD